MHYHLALFLDGNKIQFTSKLHGFLSDKWAKNGHARRIGFKNNHLKDSIEFVICKITTNKKDNLTYGLSYLARTRTKGEREDQVSEIFIKPVD